MNKQPEALRLADAIDPLTCNRLDNLTCATAAAELRRLHGLDFALRDCELALQKMATKYMDAVDQRDALLEALKQHGAHHGNCDYMILLTSLPPMRKPCSCGLHAAIAKAEGEPK
jgi:hypothetical protein